MNETIITIFAMLGLVFLSAYFSAAEAAFSSMSRTRLKSLSDYGDKSAKRVLRIAEDDDRLLSTLMVGKSLATIGLASLGTVFFVKHFGENYGASLATVVITAAVLIFGEISPKSFAKENPEDLAMLLAPSAAFFIALLRPAYFLFSGWKKVISRAFKARRDRRLTHSELLELVDEVERERGTVEFGDLAR